MPTDLKQKLSQFLGGGDSKCTVDEGPEPLATLVFIVMLLGFAGRALSYGEDVHRLSTTADVAMDGTGPVAPRGTQITALVLAFLAQLLAVVFYYRKYHRCQSVMGFMVFIVVTAIVMFIVGSVLSPPFRPTGKRCPAAAVMHQCSGGDPAARQG